MTIARALLTFSFIVLLPGLSAIGQGFDHSHARWAQVLKKRVSTYSWSEKKSRYQAAGGADYHTTRVDYSGLLDEQVMARRQRRQTTLQQYISALESVSKTDFAKFKRMERLAFLINAYNAATVQLIVDSIPITSILEVDIDEETGESATFRRTKVIKLFGTERTLDEIENKLIRAVFNEPRIHAAVNCASHGCPPLYITPFIGSRLDAQLTDNMRRFLKDPGKSFFRAETDTFYVSSIFEWFRGDFEEPGRGLAGFLAQYQKRVRPDSNLRFLQYDWTLNAANLSTSPTSVRVDVVSTEVPWPRGIVLASLAAKSTAKQQLYVLARGRARKGGGPGRDVDDFAGSIYTVDPTQTRRYDRDIDNPVRQLANGKLTHEPDKRVFKLYTNADPARDDIEADRPYTSLTWDAVTRNFFITGFSGIDGIANKRQFRKNATDSLLRFHVDNEKWFMVERHRAEIVPEDMRRGVNTFSIPNGFYPHYRGDQRASSRPTAGEEPQLLDPPATANPPQGWLNGPDGLLVVSGNKFHWLYAVAKDNHRLVRYDLKSIKADPEAGPPPGVIAMQGDKIFTSNGGRVPMRGYSCLAEYNGHLYLGSRADGNIVRFQLREDGVIASTIAPEFVATVGQGRDLIDMKVTRDGVMFVSLSRTREIMRIDLRTPPPKPIKRFSYGFPLGTESLTVPDKLRSRSSDRPSVSRSFAGGDKMTNLAVDSKLVDGVLLREIYVCTNAPVAGQDTAGTIFKITLKEPKPSKSLDSYTRILGQPGLINLATAPKISELVRSPTLLSNVQLIDANNAEEALKFGEDVRSGMMSTGAFSSVFQLPDTTR